MKSSITRIKLFASSTYHKEMDHNVISPWFKDTKSEFFDLTVQDDILKIFSNMLNENYIHVDNLREADRPLLIIAPDIGLDPMGKGLTFITNNTYVYDYRSVNGKMKLAIFLKGSDTSNTFQMIGVGEYSYAEGRKNRPSFIFDNKLYKNGSKGLLTIGADLETLYTELADKFLLWQSLITVSDTGWFDKPNDLSMRNIPMSMRDYHQAYYLLPDLREKGMRILSEAESRSISSAVRKPDAYDKLRELIYKTKKHPSLPNIKKTNMFVFNWDNEPLSYDPRIFLDLPFDDFFVVDKNSNLMLGNAAVRVFKGKLYFCLLADKVYHHSTIDISSIGFTGVEQYPSFGTSQLRITPYGIKSLDVDILRFINMVVCFLNRFHTLTKEERVPTGESHDRHISNLVDNSSTHVLVRLAERRKQTTSGHLGGKHASPREHERIGHWREYKSGKRTFVKSMIVNKGVKGKVTKEYHINEKGE